MPATTAGGNGRSAYVRALGLGATRGESVLFDERCRYDDNEGRERKDGDKADEGVDPWPLCVGDVGLAGTEMASRGRVRLCDILLHKLPYNH
jgi:hypothetical protein